MKKVLKFILWGLIVVVGVGAFGVLATLISGGFNPAKIYINNLTINGVKEYATISQNDESYVGRVDFLPANANQLTLTAKIVTGSDVIESMPTVVAGQNFTIKYAKTTLTDAAGNEVEVTRGGEIEIKFVDASQNAYATLKILVDVKLTSNNLVVSSNEMLVGENGAANANKGVLNSSVNVATSQKNSIKIKPTYNNMINSYKGSWSDSTVNSIVDAKRMKKMLYFNSDDSKTVKSVKDLKLEYVNTTTDKYYLFTYLSPATTIADPTKISVYLYRTYYLESLFGENLGKSIVTALSNNVFSESALDYNAINTFVNTYMYANCNDEQKSALSALVNQQNGLVDFNASNKYESLVNGLNAVLNFVYVHFDINITVKNITISAITVPTITNFSVLTERDYGVQELNNIASDDGNLNVSLVAGEGISVDNEVLINNLRKVEIFVCEKVDDVNDLTLYKDYFVFGGNSYKILGNNSSLKITKTTDENGNTIWKLRTQINTPSTSEYFLVYRYRNNDVSAVTLGQYSDGGVPEYYYYDSARGIWQGYDASNKLVDITDQTKIDKISNVRTYMYSATERIWKDATEGTLQELKDNRIRELLQKRFEDVYGYSQFKVDYVQGDISFVGDKTLEPFVLNKNRVVYRIDENNERSEVTGLNYETKTYYVGGENSSVKLTPIAGSTRDMEYTTVKWLIKEEDNKIEGSDFYKFQPAMRRVSSGNTVSWQPYTYYLKRADSRSVITDSDGSDIKFMEVGTNEFTLKALNAFSGEVQLWAVVIQTIDKDGTPYIEDDGANTFYYSVCYKTQSLTTSKYIENLYAFGQDGMDYTDMTSNPLKVSQGTPVLVYLSSVKLRVGEGGVIEVDEQQSNIRLKDAICYNENGKLIATTTDNENTIVIENAVDFKNNEKVAIKNYYDTIKDVWDSGVKKVTAQVESGGDYGYSISLVNFDESGENFFITISISNSGGNATKTFNLQIFANGTGTMNQYFSYIPNGVTFAFQLVNNAS